MLPQLYLRLLPARLRTRRPIEAETQNSGIRPTLPAKRRLGKSWIATGAVLLGLFLSLGIAQAAPPTVILNIPLGGMPIGVVVNPVNNRVYVTSRNPDVVSVIDGMSHSLITTIGIGPGSSDIDLNPNTNRIYVPSPASSNISVIDGATNTVITNIPTGFMPGAVRVNPATNRIYVSNSSGNSVSVLDGTTNTIVANIPVGNRPEEIGVNPNTNRIYVTNYFSNDVSVIDGTTNTVIATVGVGNNPEGVDVNPNTNLIYVSNLTSNNVNVINGATNTVIMTIGVGAFPDGVSVNPNTNLIYVVNVSGSVSIIDGTTNTVAFTVGVGSNPNFVDINPNTNLAYVPNIMSGNVSVIGDVIPPLLAKSFSPTTINPGTVSTLTFTLTNPSSGYPLGGVGFTDNLPSQLKIAAAPNPTNTCGNGSLTALPGGTSISLNGMSLAPSQTCTVSVDVTSNVPGSWTNIINSVGYFGRASPVNVTATLNVTPPVLSIGNATQNEGNAGQTAFNFPVTLSAPVSIPVTVTYNTTDGTATTADNDYQSVAGGSITIPPGQSGGTITILVNGDSVFEQDETFSVTLSNPQGATIGTGTGTGTITNDDGVPILSINNIAQNEGNAGTTPFSFTVSLSGLSSQPVTVTYSTSDGTATSIDNDYQPVTNGTVVIPAGQTSQTVTVLVNGDTKFETNETFTVALSKPQGVALGSGIGTATITNDDGLSGLSIGDYSHSEGNSGTTGFVFNVTLASSSGLTVTVDYTTANGTAQSGLDYTSTSGTLIFPPGVTSLTITVPVVGDITPEPDETFRIILSNPTNATLTRNEATGLILNDDTALSISDVKVKEGQKGTTQASFVVSLYAPIQQPVSVDYATADGSATVADHDYQPTAGTLTFNPGVNSLTVTVLVNGDTKEEADETFSVTLSNPQGAPISKGVGTGTIINDDSLPEPADLAVSLLVSPDREFDVKGQNFLSYTLVVTNLGPGESNRPALQLPFEPDFDLAYATFAQPETWVEKIVTSGPELADGKLPYVQVRLPALSSGQVVTTSLYLRPNQTARSGHNVFTRARVQWDDAAGAGKIHYSNAVHFLLTAGSERDDSGGLIQFLSLDPAPITQDRTGYIHLRLRGDFYAPDEKIELWYTGLSGLSKGLGYTYAGRDGQAELDLYLPAGELTLGQTYTFAGKGVRSGVIGSLALTFDGTASPATPGNGKGSAEGSYVYHQAELSPQILRLLLARLEQK